MVQPESDKAILEKKAADVIDKDIVAVHRAQWGRAGYDMATALQAYEETLQKLRSDSRSVPVLNSLEEAEASSSRLPQATPPLRDHQGERDFVAGRVEGTAHADDSDASQLATLKTWV